MPAATCPFQPAPQAPSGQAPAATSPLQPDTVLLLLRPQRMVVQERVDAAGQPQLQLFYDDQDICFDEPELFALARTLARTPRFAAREALGWGEPGPWARIAPLLQALLDAGVLHLADPAHEALARRRVADAAGERPSPLPPAACARPRTWHELPGLMQELAGQPLDPAHLELVVPIFRVAHMALDAEGRQVGEANAFPAALRLEVPTRWRTCIYAGSRHLDDKPMNVSALKAMRAHWGAMMAMLLHMRSAYLRRCPEAGAGWTVGHLERLATAVLALPALQLMRRERRVANGALHPVLSSMFRVTDGLRMTMHHMLFIPFGEPTRHPDTPMGSAEVHAYAERAFSLHSEHGVCAGPQAMIDEFLAVLIDGRLPREGLPPTLDAALQASIDDLDAAIDYAMLGLRSYAAVFSFWPLMMRSVEQLHALLQAWAQDEPSPAVLAAGHALQQQVQRLRSQAHLGTEAWRLDRERVYADMHAQCGRALAGRWPGGRAGQTPDLPLPQCLAPVPLPAGSTVAATVQAALLRRFGPPATAAQRQHRAAWQAWLLDFAQRAQAVLRTACQAQLHTGRLLGRDAPRQRFTLEHVDLYVQLEGSTDGRVPFLPETLRRVFGIALDIDADGIAVTHMAAAGEQPAACPQESPDMVSAM